MPRRLETLVELALQRLPNRIAIRFDDHAAFDDFGRLGHIALYAPRPDTTQQNLDFLQ